MLAASACGGQTERNDAAPDPAALDAVMNNPSAASSSVKVIARPKDQAQLDRMILAGYTPHADHLHPPGVNECPLTKGNEVVM